jgi:chromosomal replication initiation ATPase DnaA
MKLKNYIIKEELTTKQKIQISVKRYQSSFYKRFGFRPIIIYEDIHDIKIAAIMKKRLNTTITLDDLVRIVDGFVNMSIFPDGIKTKSRKKDIVILRQIYMYFAYKFDFSVVNTAQKIGYHHAMVTHSVKMISNAIDTNDKLYLKNFMEIKNEIEKETGIANFL